MIKERVCILCNNVFVGYHTTKYCKDCVKIQRSRNTMKCYRKKYGNSKRIRICLNCNKTYEISANFQKYCKECALSVYRYDRLKYGEYYRLNFKDRIKEYYKIISKTSHYKFLCRKHSSLRRARKKLLSVIFTRNEWFEKVYNSGNICFICKKHFDIEHLEIDHIIPISKAHIGFIYTINDVQPLCRSCNAKKYNKMGLIK